MIDDDITTMDDPQFFDECWPSVREELDRLPRTRP